MTRRPCYTAGQVARLLGFAHRTICRLIDSGELRGFRVPGSAHRRVAHADLCAYLCRHGEYGIDLDATFGPGWDRPAGEPATQEAST